MKRLILIVLIILFIFLVSGCGYITNIKPEGINIITTIFPPYDFVREIAGDNVNVILLLPPGSESHSYEPTPQDIIKIENCDLFIYNGGKSDNWVNTILESIDNDINVLLMTDTVDIVEEEVIEGMKTEDEYISNESKDVEYDEHIWTSPVNCIKIVSAIRDALIKIDADKEEIYTDNAAEYIKKLEKLDSEFRFVADNSSIKTMMFGDRFPFRYFADEYNLKYYAAFPGCSNETEPSASTLTFLIDKIKAENITTVFYIEFSNHLIADSISEATGAKTALLHSCHTVSREDIINGTTYLSLMEQNLITLREALG